MNIASRRRDTCRLCASRALELVFPMAASPIADAYIPASRLGQTQPLFPLDLYLCADCGHLQNLDIVDPGELFQNYIFTTGSSAGLVEHFRKYADELIDRFAPGPGRLVAEIGSNDGTLLSFFKARGFQVQGIDPAQDIARQASARGIDTRADFFTASLGHALRRERGPAALVCANNVFAHADDLGDIADGIRELLADDGIFVFEVSYVADIVDNYLFDTVYHEHVSYHSVAPLVRFLDRHGLQLFDIQRIASKGGSIRAFAQKREQGRRPVTPAVAELMQSEIRRGLGTAKAYRDFARRVDARKQALLDLVTGELSRGAVIAGYGASTTTTTLMWHFDLTRRLAFILDDNPKKHGWFTPGNHLPVVPSDELYVRRPDLVVILAWQYAAPIMAKHGRYLREGGRFVIPLTDLRIVTTP